MRTDYKPFAEITRRSSFGTFICLSEWTSLHDVQKRYNVVRAYRYNTDDDAICENHQYSDGEGAYIYLLANDASDLSALKGVNIRANWELKLFHTNGKTTVTPYLNLTVAIACGHFFEHYS